MNGYDYIEAMNYARDPRTQGAAEAPVLYMEREDGWIEEIPLPMRWTVCPVCDGEGTHVNPGIDAGGLSREDFADDPEFHEDYLLGVYDVTCNRCGGRTTVPEVDWDALTDEQSKAYEDQLADEADSRACERAERMMGA